MKDEHVNAMLKCGKCEKTCQSRFTLIRHYRQLHIEGHHPCPQEGCSYVAKYRVDLERHEASDHTKLRKCPIQGCGMMLRLSAYQTHVNRHHGVKNYHCSWPDCDKSFVDRKSLKDHVRIHIGFKVSVLAFDESITNHFLTFPHSTAIQMQVARLWLCLGTTSQRD